MKKQLILASVMTIAICLSLIAGATFALFTSDYSVNAAVTAGTVDVSAVVEDDPILSSTLGTNVPETAVTFTANTVTINQFIPGDQVSFDIVVTNNSDVTVKCRTVIAVADDDGLWSGLVVTIDNSSFDGVTAKSAWGDITPAEGDKVVHVTISLPEAAGNEYQGKTCTLVYVVEAIQGNADPSRFPSAYN